MIIKSNRKNSKFIYSLEEKPAVVKEEVKSAIKEVNKKKNNKKITPVSIDIEEPIVTEVKNENDMDLSEWLKNNIDE